MSKDTEQKSDTSCGSAAMTGYAIVWAVMKALPFEALDTDHMKFHSPADGEGQPQRFIPVFNSRDDAEIFSVDQDLIVAMKIGVEA